ncbi:serine/threonine protein phosphatase [Actinoplanes sp. NPDC049668]|uniref:serine/threonine protein phosphatase n=1 Tax=unclassified Actinoplanes TaxID=2626549 RepID=UPI0033AAC8D9
MPADAWSDRVDRHTELSERLAALSDREVEALLAGAEASTAGIGGTTQTVTVGGLPVFVKRVPLTDLERRPENAGSTANLFRLPLFYQYGIGSTGFGAWREVAVHDLTTRWVLEDRFDGFPLLYHRRVLPRDPDPMPDDELERWVAHWDGAEEVRARLRAIGSASAAVVLFLEHIPYTVDAWLAARTAAGGEAAEAAYAFVDAALLAGVDFLESHGLLHFDAHFRNLLTDGRRVYFADFGLAVHERFDLSAEESAFVRRHRSYDRCYTATHLTVWLVSNLLKIPWQDCPAYIRDQAGDPADIPASACAGRIVARHTPVAAVTERFFDAVVNVSKRTPYPAEELGGVLAGVRPGA